MDAVNLTTNTSAIRNLDEELRQTKTNQTNTVNSRDALTSPTTDLAKTAQVATDIVVASSASGNLNQLVIEKNNPAAIQKVEDANLALNRNVGAIATQSNIGTQSDVNALAAEINAKSGDF